MLMIDRKRFFINRKNIRHISYSYIPDSRTSNCVHKISEKKY